MTELPIGVWTRSFKNDLEEMINKQNLVVDLKEYHKTDSVHFKIICNEE